MEFAENSFGIPVCSERQFPIHRYLCYYVHIVCKYTYMHDSIKCSGIIIGSMERDTFEQQL